MKHPALKRLAWMLKRMSYLMEFQRFGSAKEILMRANIALSKLDPDSSLFVRRRFELNAAMLELSKARYWGTAAIQSRSRSDWARSRSSFKRAISLGRALLSLVERGNEEPLEVPSHQFNHANAEILFVDGAPVVPEVCPLIVLEGSSYQMGYQYAQQVVQVFGRWMLERKTGRRFSAANLRELRAWEGVVEKHAPEILEMCRGWVAGAADSGLPMTYDEVLDIWTGHTPPKSTFMGRGDELTDTPPSFACSGAAAWGRATTDGRLVTGSSGDHDPSFPVVIMAYPDTGNNFMFTSFSAVGEISLVGAVHMFGHPGMNSKGVAYVEHGGQPRMIEPRKYWGYGLRRATSVLHNLRFAASAREALELELSAPVGDVGMDNFTIGGFYADSSYGYVLESRKEPVAVREAGYMGETDFLYANNSAMHREAARAEWMVSDQAEHGDWEWDEHGGWRPHNFQGLKLADLFRGGEGQARLALRGMYYGSARRNLFHWAELSRALGSIDVDFMRALFRKKGAQPAVPWKQQVRDYNRTGAWGEITVGHAGNGVLTVTRPDDGPNGLYSVCVGQAARGMPANSPFFASFCPTYNETNTFWEIRLAEGPAAAAEDALARAQTLVEEAECRAGQGGGCTEARRLTSELLEEAQSALEEARRGLGESTGLTGNAALYRVARAARSALTAQAKAAQTRDLLEAINRSRA